MKFKVSGNTKEFDTLSIYGRIKTDAITVETLRGNIAEKNKNRRRIWEITINPTSIKSDADLQFLEDFFYSSGREISLDGTNWRRVALSAGDFPVDFHDGIKSMPVIKFNLISATPDPSPLVGETYI